LPSTAIAKVDGLCSPRGELIVYGRVVQIITGVYRAGQALNMEDPAVGSELKVGFHILYLCF
jgi:hypothetical protein